MTEINNINMDFKEYKNTNKKYLNELQKYFDLVDNIEDEKLKKSIIYQKMKCDDILEEVFYKFLKEN